VVMAIDVDREISNGSDRIDSLGGASAKHVGKGNGDDGMLVGAIIPDMPSDSSSPIGDGLSRPLPTYQSVHLECIATRPLVSQGRVSNAYMLAYQSKTPYPSLAGISRLVPVSNRRWSELDPLFDLPPFPNRHHSFKHVILQNPRSPRLSFPIC
jgi:hypothetical protein